MSNTKGIKKKKNVINRQKVEIEHVSKTIKIEDVSTTSTADEGDRKTIHKEPLIGGPNAKIIYRCQYCSKIFFRKLSNATHMKKCPKKIKREFQAMKSGVSNSDINQGQLRSGLSFNHDQNENKRTEKNLLPVNRAVPDVSVYDYNESDEDPAEKDMKENNDGSLKNRQCKHCGTLFDNPLDLLRHTRDCHNFPRTILPLEEIEKYFNYPNRHFCPICEKPIKTRNFRSVFIKHLLVHTTGLTHECKICKRKFRRRDHMRAHEKRHVVSG